MTVYLNAKDSNTISHTLQLHQCEELQHRIIIIIIIIIK